jgi:hypothetical protein
VDANDRQNAEPADLWDPYGPQIGAWSEDGQTLLAAAATVDELVEELEQLGVTRFLVGIVPPIDCWLGGFTDCSISGEPELVSDQDR